jgi:hypothetical protein
LQFIQFLAHAFDDLLRVGTGQSQHQSLHGFGLAALRHHTIACDGADLDLGQVAETDRYIVLHRHHDRTQVVQAGDASLAAHQQHFVAFAEPARAVVAVVGV